MIFGTLTIRSSSSATCRQRRRDGKGGWIWSLNGTRRVLYRLPEVIKAKLVIIAEGEKDVETARKLGLTATCNPHGVRKWRPEHAEFLRGKRVAIIADADAPGRAHGHEVAVRHLNKSNSANPKYRGGGSIGTTGLARANFIFGEDPDEPGTFVMPWSNGNLAAKPTAMRYTLEESEHGLHVRWPGTSEHTARTLLAEPGSQEDANDMQEATEFLLEALKDGPLGVKELKRDAKNAGHAERTIDRAKARLGIRSQERDFGGGWEWVLPNDAKAARNATKNANYQDLAAFEQDLETKRFNSSISPKNAKVGNMAAFEGEDGSIRLNSELSSSKSWTTPAPDEPVESRSLEGEL